MESKPATTISEIDKNGLMAGGARSAGHLLSGITVEFQVGEERRCNARLFIDELAPSTFVVLPKALRVIGGNDLLWNRPERGVPIIGAFTTLEDAIHAAKAWSAAFNETVQQEVQMSSSSSTQTLKCVLCGNCIVNSKAISVIAVDRAALAIPAGEVSSEELRRLLLATVEEVFRERDKRDAAAWRALL